MTRKRLGEGLLEAFSETCEVCHGRGVILHNEPVDRPNGGSSGDEERAPKQGNRRKRGGAGKGAAEPVEAAPMLSPEQRQQTLTAMASIHRAAHPDEHFDAEAAAEAELQAIEADALAALAEAEVAADEAAEAAEVAGAEDADDADEPAEEFAAVALEDTPAETDAPADEASAEPVVEVIEVIPEPEPIVEVAPEPIAAPPAPRRRRAASRPAGPPVGQQS
jgi:ribonuclease E